MLTRLDWSAKTASFKNGCSPSSPGDSLEMRPLRLSDYHRGFLQLLGQLTLVGEVSFDEFKERFSAMKQCRDTYYILVVEDTGTKELIGCATLLVEQKFIHSAGTRGRVEDVVVHSEYRGRQLGKLLVETLTLLGKLVDCYKMSLECKPENVKFYETFGYAPDGQLFMVQRYKD
ncbi:hypothetical protein NP493_82g03035 [Ridgeia piscesae]|uniref:Glucosamine 6-phosphate N-acetyltransferase n=2 Tax=Ridgeia piscesae TaxID=27915 RepID=A0AAD9MQ03_RIDPI|nr:hypothetical protein NP493_6377g00011 [Ridgeia piscesae]KAK2190386.1 hypothetical protein NP493_82g03035 [Ridgeia piscesae]